jgi:fluoroacetyl-CoA thioesterase
MTSAQLLPGLQHRQTIIVDERLTVPNVAQAFTGFADMPPVLATAFLVGFVEWTCVEALRPHLTVGQRTVGVHVDISHTAATPIGMAVTVEVELLSVTDRRLRFKVVCRDEVEIISEGHHDRFLIDADRFMARMEKKTASRAAPLTQK